MDAPHNVEEPHPAASVSAAVPTNVCNDSPSKSSKIDGLIAEHEHESHFKTLATPRRILPNTSKPSDTAASLARPASAFQPPTPSTSFQTEQDKNSIARVITVIFCCALLFCVLNWSVFTVKNFQSYFVCENNMLTILFRRVLIYCFQQLVWYYRRNQ